MKNAFQRGRSKALLESIMNTDYVDELLVIPVVLSVETPLCYEYCGKRYDYECCCHGAPPEYEMKMKPWDVIVFTYNISIADV